MEEFEHGISMSNITGEWLDDRSLLLETLVMQFLGTLAIKIPRISGRWFDVLASRCSEKEVVVFLYFSCLLGYERFCSYVR